MTFGTELADSDFFGFPEGAIALCAEHYGAARLLLDARRSWMPATNSEPWVRVSRRVWDGEPATYLYYDRPVSERSSSPTPDLIAGSDSGWVVAASDQTRTIMDCLNHSISVRLGLLYDRFPELKPIIESPGPRAWRLIGDSGAYIEYPESEWHPEDREQPLPVIHKSWPALSVASGGGVIGPRYRIGEAVWVMPAGATRYHDIIPEPGMAGRIGPGYPMPDDDSRTWRYDVTVGQHDDSVSVLENEIDHLAASLAGEVDLPPPFEAWFEETWGEFAADYWRFQVSVRVIVATDVEDEALLIADLCQAAIEARIRLRGLVRRMGYLRREEPAEPLEYEISFELWCADPAYPAVASMAELVGVRLQAPKKSQDIEFTWHAWNDPGQQFLDRRVRYLSVYGDLFETSMLGEKTADE
jgi:hypothetical protein